MSAHLDGELLTVQGVGHDLHDPGRRTHLAFAMLRYDIDRRQYRWHAYSAGEWTDTDFRLTPHAFTWSLEANPQKVIRTPRASKATGGTKSARSPPSAQPGQPSRR